MKLINNSLYINPQNPSANKEKLRRGGMRPGQSTYVHVNDTGYDVLKAPKIRYNPKKVFSNSSIHKPHIRPAKLMDYRKIKNPLSLDVEMASML